MHAHELIDRGGNFGTGGPVPVGGRLARAAWRTLHEPSHLQVPDHILNRLPPDMQLCGHVFDCPGRRSIAVLISMQKPQHLQLFMRFDLFQQQSARRWR